VPQLSTGFVIAGAYADKLRRVLFAQLRDEIKKGAIESKQVAYRAGELNRLLFEILVNKLKIDKGDVVRIRIEYELKDGDIEWKLDTLRVEAFRRIPDEEVDKAVKEVISAAKEVLERPVSEEERAWTEAKEREVEREVAARREEIVAAKAEEEYKPPTRIADALSVGKTRSGEELLILKDEKGGNVGLVILSSMDGKTKAKIIVVHGKEAYSAETILEEEIEQIASNTEKIVEITNNISYKKIGKQDAEKIIKQKLEELY
jgi:hypothetical protein